MGKAHNPRHGSMQFWPRKLAKRFYARIRSWPKAKEASLLGFAGYKAGMTHIIFNDPKSKKGAQINWPVTIIECPPIKIASARFYKKNVYGSRVVSEVLAGKLDKELKRKINIPKNTKNIDDIKDFDDIRVNVFTQPKLTGIGKKKPEFFEVALGGSKEEKLNFVKENLGKEVKISDVFKAGEQLDFHCVTTGKGFQGPVKRFGVSIRGRKSEKTKRGPGSLGSWKGQQHMMPRVAHAGKMGFHTRTEYNKLLVKIDNNPEDVKFNGGMPHYGDIKNEFILVKGSVGGPRKRIVRIVKPIRPNKLISSQVPEINYMSLR